MKPSRADLRLFIVKSNSAGGQPFFILFFQFRQLAKIKKMIALGWNRICLAA